MRELTRVAVAMSGGVDSSVTAGLLKSEGYDVFGLMLRLWSPSTEIENRCCSPADLALAQGVAARLDIPLYTLDAKKDFKAAVVDPFIYGYAKGITPNPCISCNRQIRWGFLLDRALAMGASHMATGHYARVHEDDHGYQLLRAVDRSKDQSYILSILNQKQLSHTLFPLGRYTKDYVRQLADYRTFLDQQLIELPPPGPIVNNGGDLLGQHEGLASYTIGQRKGIGISASEPYYVLKKNTAKNQLIIGTRDELGRNEFTVNHPNWISGNPPVKPIQAMVRIRYKSREVQSTLIPNGINNLRVEVQEPLPDITPGQAAVFYRDELCLGGGIISA
jgi:tRNA-specific 2-thiouridylase